MAERNSRTVRDLRLGNRASVLRRLYFHGPMSRQALGGATGLSSGSVSNVVAELTADHLLEEAGVVESDGGRPRTLLRVAPGSGHLIGVDVGETRVRVEAFDLALTELARTDRPLTPTGHDVEAVVGHIRDGIAEVTAAAGLTAGEGLIGVGVGVPGIVETTAPGGALVHGQTVGWDAVPLESLLREAVRLPADTAYFIDNGARALGQAEMWFGGGRGVRDAVIVLFGSGVGACIVTDGVIHGGAHGGPGEWGHLTVHVRGRRCRCGALGCLEAYAGAEALLDRWREAGGEPPATGEESGVAALLAAAHPEGGGAGDPVARAVLDETAEYLGAGISGLVNLFGPERVLVGGWAGLALGPHLLPAVREHAAAYSLRHPAARVTVALGELGPDAVTVGAATLPLADFLARGGRRREETGEAPGAGPLLGPAARAAL
ncbi:MULTISPECIES: ROK family transcriptional regulator [Streptomyces]|uniref:ROK family transcriptional regulator n=1 Tax=Streptomyces alboflavus TaxID=67267 RepID=A0A1Z1W422_9ACTN|nr:ROK family transcriptional regulator [Streptomyces alboflavus]ARX81171.1 ROK family transcriptional regulator [Streptomyces alboflavus]